MRVGSTAVKPISTSLIVTSLMTSLSTFAKKLVQILKIKFGPITNAQKLAPQQKNVVAVGNLRPGYADDWGRTSDGCLGDTVGDNYDEETKPYLTKQYFRELKKQVKHLEKKIIESGHNVFQTTAEMEIISKAL